MRLGPISLLQALDFFKLAYKYILEEELDRPHHMKLLDFGCGWGRITRMFLKIFPAENIYAIDPMSEMIDLCKETITIVHFYKSNPAPPISNIHESMFDILTAYSVFSHLNKEYVNLWFTEFSRLMKKGGLLLITTRSRDFIEHIQNLRTNQRIPDYAIALEDCFVDVDSAYKEYDNGNIIHQPIGGGSLSNSFYGETCIPESYFRNFSTDFQILDFVPKMTYENNQACVIMKRK